MKKMFFVALATLAISAILHSCNKEAVNAESTPTPSSCSTSVFLVPDSLYMNCTGKSIFYNASNGKSYVVNNAIAAIDTIRNGANFKIDFDSIGNFNCSGRIFSLINITCHTKL